MALQLYTLSGSPFGWKVQLALAAKTIPHVITPLSADQGDLKTAWFRALNPHGKLPVLVDESFVLFESDVIVEYLNDAFPAFGPDLLPREAKARARVRRIAIEASAYLYPPLRRMVVNWSAIEAERELVASSRSEVAEQLESFKSQLQGAYFNGEQAGAADFALYPMVALVKRLDARRPEEDLRLILPENILSWAACIESLPGFETTFPPHWRA